MKIARQERLPEADLMGIKHASDPRLAGKLQVAGDPTFLML